MPGDKLNPGVTLADERPHSLRIALDPWWRILGNTTAEGEWKSGRMRRQGPFRAEAATHS
jgi:hypothetical protein